MSDGTTANVAYGVVIPVTPESVVQVIDWINSNLREPYDFPTFEKEGERDPLERVDWDLIDFTEDLDYAFYEFARSEPGMAFQKSLQLELRSVRVTDPGNDSPVDIHVYYKKATSEANAEETAAPVFFSIDVPQDVVYKIEELAEKVNASFGYYLQISS